MKRNDLDRIKWEELIKDLANIKTEERWPGGQRSIDFVPENKILRLYGDVPEFRALFVENLRAISRRDHRELFYRAENLPASDVALLEELIIGKHQDLSDNEREFLSSRLEDLRRWTNENKKLLPYPEVSNLTNTLLNFDIDGCWTIRERLLILIILIKFGIYESDNKTGEIKARGSEALQSLLGVVLAENSSSVKEALTERRSVNLDEIEGLTRQLRDAKIPEEENKIRKKLGKRYSTVLKLEAINNLLIKDVKNCKNAEAKAWVNNNTRRIQSLKELALDALGGRNDDFISSLSIGERLFLLTEIASSDLMFKNGAGDFEIYGLTDECAGLINTVLSKILNVPIDLIDRSVQDVNQYFTSQKSDDDSWRRTSRRVRELFGKAGAGRLFSHRDKSIPLKFKWAVEYLNNL